jgi:hypothetical protein
MEFDQWSGRAQRPFVSVPGESVAEHRARLALQATDQLERRERERLEQRSLDLTPEQRLHLWERLHQLRIPSRLQGTLGSVIAGDTGLSIEQVREALHARANPAAHVAPVAPAPDPAEPQA